MTDPAAGAQPPHPAPPVPPIPAAPPVSQPQPPYFAPPSAQAGHATQPADQPPHGYAQPPQVYARPPQGYAQPSQGYAQPPQGYVQPPQGYGPFVPQPSAAAPRASAPGLGIFAFVLAIAAAIVAPVVGAVAAFSVGSGIDPRSLSSIEQPDSSFDWSILTPVREAVLWAEIAFWVGTVLGIWAIAQGIVAIARTRGRGWGIAAVVLAILGALIFGGSVTFAGFAGLATSAGQLG